MSGHSKWSTIKRKKGALDSKRSKIFSRISKEISVAVKEGGGSDPEMNPRLRIAINNAKGVNMPKDNIQRAIAKAEKDGDALQEMTFEGYGPEGVPIFVECLSDNNNRTLSAIRSIFSKRGGSLGTNGSLGFLFDRKGVFTIPTANVEMEIDELELELIDAGAEDFEVNDDTIVIYTAMTDFGRMQKKLDELNIELENASLQRIPNDYKKLEPQEAMKVLRMIDEFEDNDDVQSVYHNIEMTDDLMKAMEESD
jgi:YebC/PmpR family DNA-binding regulatory protein